MNKMTWYDWIALVLMVVGGLNWGLVGFFKYDLVATLFGGSDAMISRVIYDLVGVSALWTIVKALMGGAKAKPAMETPKPMV